MSIDVTTLNLRHFFALVDISRTGRISEAAEQLFLSQSALTQALRKLEKAAETPLFDRDGYGVSKTEAGGLLIRRSQRAIDLLVSVEDELLAFGNLATRQLYRHVRSSQLRALSAIVEAGGYSLAARRLGVAQPTVHRAGRELENMLGIDLFRPTPRGVDLTDAARLLAQVSELVFSEIRQGFEEVREMQGNMRSRIAVGSLPLGRSELLPWAVNRLLEDYPDAQVSILDGPYIEQIHALRYGQIDWLIGALRKPDITRGLDQLRLFEQSLVVVVRPGHPLAASRNVPIDELAALDWIAPRRFAPAREFFTQLFSNAGLQSPARIVECSSLVATRGLLLGSDRAALLSPSQVRSDVESGQLAVVGNAIPESSRSIGVTTRQNWEPTRLQAHFTELLHQYSGEISDEF